MMITRARVLFAFVATALVACSSAPPDSPLQGQDPASTPKKKSSTATNNNDSEGQNTNSGTVATQNPTDPAAPAPATPATPAPTNGQCAASASFDACFSCCDQAFPGGFDFDSQTFGACVCQSPGTCAAACGTSFCAGAQATPACEQCLSTATQCQQTADAACAANANCNGALNCFDSSGCDAKP